MASLDDVRSVKIKHAMVGVRHRSEKIEAHIGSLGRRGRRNGSSHPRNFADDRADKAVRAHAAEIGEVQSAAPVQNAKVCEMRTIRPDVDSIGADSVSASVAGCAEHIDILPVWILRPRIEIEEMT